MKQIFKKLDKYEDNYVSRKEFVKKLKENLVLRKNLDKPAVYIANLDKTLTLRILLTSVERYAEVDEKDHRKLELDKIKNPHKYREPVRRKKKRKKSRKMQRKDRKKLKNKGTKKKN